MFQTRVTRVGLVIAVVGLAVLGASLFHWVQTTRSKGLLYSTNDYEWVVSSASNKPAVSRDEIWDLPASCVKQFYLTEINNLEAKRSSHASLPFFHKLIPSLATESLRTRRRIILGF